MSRSSPSPPNRVSAVASPTIQLLPVVPVVPGRKSKPCSDRTVLLALKSWMVTVDTTWPARSLEMRKSWPT